MSGSAFLRSPWSRSARSASSPAAFRCRCAYREGEAEGAPGIPPWTFAAAGILALAPAAAILPKFYGDAVQLADPIFDHSKSAIIDAITRLGVPPVNPVFGEFGAPGHLAYYYLWHFSAAEVAAAAGATGWEADIGLTWFTAFASLTLMMGLAVWLGKRPAAAIWVVALAAAGSLWITLYWIRRDRQSDAGAVGPGRYGRLAVSGHLGAPASDGGVMRGDGDAASCASDGAAELHADSDAWRWSLSPASKARPLSAALRSRLPRSWPRRFFSPQPIRRDAGA